METSKMYERINWYKKEFVYEQYTRIVQPFKDYEKISKTKMLEAIYKVYSDYNNIIDICTVKELKYLKMLLNEKIPMEQKYDKKYEWERKMLGNKFLIQQDYPNIVFIPDEIIVNVREAIKNVDFEVAKRMDNVNEILVSYCKIQASSLLDMACSVVSAITGIKEDIIRLHALHNRLFNYYVMIYPKNIEGLGDDILVALYQDYYGIEEQIEEERQKQGIAGSIKIDTKVYKTLFYNDFDVNNKKIKKMLDEIQKLPFFWVFALDIIRQYAVLNIDRASLKQSISDVPALKDCDLEDFFKILDVAMDEMPSAALNGLTPNEAKRIKLEEVKSNIEKDRSYVRQTNASLSKKDAKLFYKIYFALLDFTNKKYRIKPNLKIYNATGVNPYDIKDIITKFWENKDLLVVEFCLANPYKFNNEELKITGEFKKGVRDIFVIVKFEEEYTAFMSKNKIYMVKGLYDNLDKIISYKNLPYAGMTTIIPFKNVLIYDGVLFELGIKMGIDFEKMVAKEYSSSIKYYHL